MNPQSTLTPEELEELKALEKIIPAQMQLVADLHFALQEYDTTVGKLADDFDATPEQMDANAITDVRMVLNSI